MSVVQEDSVTPPIMSVVQEDSVAPPTMSVVQEDSVTTPSHSEFDPSTTVEDDSYTSSSDDEFDFSINESYRVRFGNLTIFNRQSVHGKLNEIVSEAQVPTLSIEIQLKEYSRRLDAGGHQSEPTVEVRRVVEIFSDDLHYFLQAETSKSRIAKMISHLNIHRDCVESVALNINYIAKKAHEAGKEMVQIVAEFEILEILEILELIEEEEEETLARMLRESMDLAFERRDSAVPALRSSVEALKRMSFNKGESDEIKCTICLNEFSIGKEVICMPCSHIFYCECIIQWMEMNHVCPICRFKMPPQQFEEI